MSGSSRTGSRRERYTHADLLRLNRVEKRLDFYLEGWPGTTLALVAALFVVQAAVGLSQRGRAGWIARYVFTHPKKLMVRFGARDGALVADGQWWRLFTHGFLHWGLLHLLLNAAALVVLGRVCQAVFGRVRFVWLFLVSVLGGGLLSQTGPADVVSAGASGGIFGLLGGVALFGLRHRRDLSYELRALFGWQLWPWIVLNLAVGLVLPFIDNRAHLGGLIAGSVTGALLGNRITDNAQGRLVVTVGMGVAVGVVLAGTAYAMWASAFPG
jgi:membrane associated rhomboid family serine protease